MKSSATPRFWKLYEALPVAVQRKADKAYGLWHENPYHPSLHFKKVGRFWSVRVDDNFRAIAEVRDDTAYWLWIGDHGEYELLIARKR
ncbi:hypothetical protein FEM03_21010 [Phragmitibacter flavus]|uniref:Type II toxin-antitoxin system HigB family toxin n=1 Tax=Phragmitibacter flavus TaxID=2576071 RepID=A0A5R8K926_9BACT|nr:hypothetical protein FEM03_21010 [Phragmitibacter flavus]